MPPYRFPRPWLAAELAALACLLLCAPVSAEIEMIAEPNERNPIYHWWPKVDIPKGWARAPADSFHYDVSAMAPDGVEFDKADRVMYAQAVSKVSEPQAKTLSQFIARDHKKLRANASGPVIKPAPGLRTADGKRLQSFTLFPKTQGSWERVAYAEEGEFYLIFTLSARSKQSYQAASGAFEQLVRSYQGKPVKAP
jgi:hypothetical protein